MAGSAQTTTGQDGKDVPAAEAHRASREAFARAQRHSRTVRVLKSALPVLAAAMALGFLGYSYVMTPGSVAVKADGSAISDGKLVMANPKLDGFTKDNRPYSMNALRAIQDFQNEGVVQLEGISARLPIDAEGGVYDRDKNTLEIDTEITVETADGMTAKLQSATIDIGAGGMTTDDPVDIRMDGATITSDTMSIGENGKVLVFEKRVRMDIDPQRLKATQQANGDPDVVN